MIHQVIKAIKSEIEDMRKTIIEDNDPEIIESMRANARSFNRGLLKALEIIDDVAGSECSICRRKHISDDRHPCE